jgi:two-component system CheB/CheR fusion protein
MLYASSELARSALDAAPDAMIIIDAAGIIRFANRQVTALFGYTHDDVVGRAVEELMPERFRNRHAAHRQSYTTALRSRPMGIGLALLGRRKDGMEFPVEISLSPIEGTSEVLVAAAIRDVSDRMRVEAELRAAQETAERARVAADQSRDSADRANQAKSRFLATASHDLRQPLQTLALLNGSLRRMVGDPDAREALSQQDQAIDAMARLLNALLDISKVESGAIRPDPSDFEVAALLQGLRHEFASLAVNKGLELRVEASGEIAHSDRSLVEQIMKNLISNAIKYTRKGYVLLRSSLEEQDDIRIDVLDTGIGIPPEQIAYIYDEFYQVGVPANSSRDGYGLGLSIVQRLVGLLGLRLDVRSQVGKGTVFSLVVPRGRAQHSAAPAESRPSSARAARSARAHVLLVEDDAAVRDATRMLLKVEGYRVTAVASLAEAERSAQRDAPDLLITDYHLANGELGTQVVTAVRSALNSEARAILVTGDTSTAVKDIPGDVRLRIISKPINAEALLALMSALLSE